MLQRRKKGFTIVELVVVIAVVAVLAAVLIPTFANIVKKAKISNDTVLVKNLNTALVTSSTIDGTPKTMHEVLARIAESGYNVDKLTPTSTGDILWDQLTNRFVLKDGENVVFAEDASKVSDKHALWKIAKTEDDIVSGAYSYYLADGFVDAENNGVTVSAGVDVGNNTILTVNYVHTTGDAQTVTIRTNGGTLNVTGLQGANGDTINHYNNVDTVNVISCGAHSYYEYGQYKFRSEKAGHIVDMVSQSDTTMRFIENAAAVYDVQANVTPVKAYVPSDIFDSIQGAANTSATLIKLEGATTTNTESVQQAIQQIQSGSVLFGGGLGTEADPYIIGNVQHWLNLCSSKLSYGAKYWSVKCDLDLSQVSEKAMIKYFSGRINFNNHTLIPSTNFDLNTQFLFEEVVAGSHFENLQYKIPNSTQYQLIKWVNGAFDGTEMFEEATTPTVLKNISTYGTVTTTHNNYSPFVLGLYDFDTVLRMENCNNYVNITSNSVNGVGVFLGKVYENASNTGRNTVQFINCNNYGTVLHPTGYAGMFFSNSCTFATFDLAKLVVENCHNYGKILAKTNVNLICGGWWSPAVMKDTLNAKVADLGDNLTNGENGQISTVETGKIQVENGKFVLPSVDSAVRYDVGFSFWYAGYMNGQEAAYSWGSAGKVCTLTSEQFEKLSLPAYQWTVNKTNAEKLFIVGGETEGDNFFYTNGSEYVFKDMIVDKGVDREEITSIKLIVVGYDVNGVAVSIATYDYN